MEKLDIKENQSVFKIGEASDKMFLLVKGKAKQNIFEKAQKEKKLPIHHLIKNRNSDFFIEKVND